MSLLESFDNYFSVELARSEEQRNDVYGIRYRVYCEEFGFLPSEHERLSDRQARAHLEFDEFDARSLHVLVKHKRSGKPAGCVRLVTTEKGMYEDPLPMEKYCAHALSIKALEMLNENRNGIGEISRLAVDPLFRRRRGENANQLGALEQLDFCHQEKRVLSLVGVASLMAAAALAELSGRTTVFAMMDPLLPRRLKEPGFLFRRIGNSIDYHGCRAPYYLTAETYHQYMPEAMRNFYYKLYGRFDRSYGHLPKLEGVRIGVHVNKAG